MIIDDEIRVANAVQSGSHMLGPIERERCHKHRRRWVLYRWVWSADGDITGGEPEVVRGCAECRAEDEATELDL